MGKGRSLTFSQIMRNLGNTAESTEASLLSTDESGELSMALSLEESGQCAYLCARVRVECACVRVECACVRAFATYKSGLTTSENLRRCVCVRAHTCVCVCMCAWVYVCVYLMFVSP